MREVTVFIVDPQNDFCSEQGSLFVPGANLDMMRLGFMILNYKHRIKRIVVTRDKHKQFHASHPCYWVNSQGKQPDLFQTISFDDVKEGRWKTTNPEYASTALWYLENMKKIKQDLYIYPKHCVDGTWGACIYEPLMIAISAWEKDACTAVEYFDKGMNQHIEQLSPLIASVVSLSDPTTHLNHKLLDVFKESEVILAAGEASSHCFGGGLLDACKYYPEFASKTTVLRDATSPVPGFENQADMIFDRLKAVGIRFTTTRNGWYK